MKKLFALALLLSFGVMVGCGEDKKPAAKTSGSAAPAAASTAK
ncbi:MAG: hypothetical protein WCJ35_17805 [Planctomycetota bacterium]